MMQYHPNKLPSLLPWRGRFQKDKKVQLIASLVLHGTGWWQMMQCHPNKLPAFLPWRETFQKEREKVQLIASNTGKPTSLRRFVFVFTSIVCSEVSWSILQTLARWFVSTPLVLEAKVQETPAWKCFDWVLQAHGAFVVRTSLQSFARKSHDQSSRLWPGATVRHL